MPSTRKQAKKNELYLHGTGQWAKTIAGKKVYFGTDLKAALDKYEAYKKNGGKEPPKPKLKTDELTVGDIVGSFRLEKENAGIATSTLREYKNVCIVISKTLGRDTLVTDIQSEDLIRLKSKLTKDLSPHSAKRKLTCCRSVFLNANEELGCHVRYRKPLSSPSAKLIRKHRHEIGERLFTPKEIRALIEAAGPQLKAMIWLGITCGFGNRDCARTADQGGRSRWWLAQLLATEDSEPATCATEAGVCCRFVFSHPEP